MKRRRYLAMGVFCAVGVSTAALTLSREKPPLSEITAARQSLAEASKVHLSGFQSDLFVSAGEQYDSAMALWNMENERFFLLRDFGEVRKHASLASKLAGEATLQTRTRIRDAAEELGVRLPSLENRISRFQLRYGQFPYEKQDMEDLTRARLLLTEGAIAFGESDYPAAMRKLDQCEAILTRLNDRYEQIESLYFSQYALWNKRVKETVERSGKEKVPCIIIDKYSRNCLLFKNGKLFKQYAVELGPNWIGDKNLQGDRSTPEGQYRVAGKKSGGQTKYHKALLLDYPNQEDRVRFMENQKNGSLHREARIGNYIEIHGHGGKGTDWTDGCIALKNTDMDELFAACETGTRVTIVGSVESLEAINERFKE